MTWHDIIPILVALVAAIPGFLAWRSRQSVIKSEAKQRNAEAAESWSVASGKLVEQYRIRNREVIAECKSKLEALEKKYADEIIAMEGRLAQLEINSAYNEKVIKLLRDGVATLIVQLERLGVEPAWRPEEIEFPNGENGD